MNEIKFIDPKNLHEHELLKRLPPLTAEDPSVLAIAQGILDLGRIHEPLKITESGELVDGRRRRMAALRLKLETVPCLYVPDTEVPLLIVTQLTARSHFTKSQIAYLAYPLLADAHEEAKRRNLERLSYGGLKGVVADSLGYGPTNATFASQLGISKDLFEQAARVHKIFEENPLYKEQMDPRIRDEDDPVGLGAVIAGWKGQQATKGSKRPDTNVWSRLRDGFASLKKWAPAWSKLEAPDQMKMATVIRDTVDKMPEELRALIAKEIKRKEREV